tara:strand:+ start:1439 stop:2203 length:765 start_codon:yes stop_codon:yes gene_type:complete
MSIKEKTLIKPKSLREALSLFQQEANFAKPTEENPFHKNKYASLAEVIKAVKGANNLGLSFTQKIGYKTTIHETGRKFIDMFVSTVLYFNETNETIVSEFPIVPLKDAYDDSQKLGSAITYAKRYSLQSLLGIPTEDNDGNSNTSVEFDANREESNVRPIKPKEINYSKGGPPFRFFAQDGSIKGETQDLTEWSKRISFLTKHNNIASLKCYEKEMNRIESDLINILDNQDPSYEQRFKHILNTLENARGVLND